MTQVFATEVVTEGQTDVVGADGCHPPFSGIQNGFLSMPGSHPVFSIILKRAHHGTVQCVKVSVRKFP